MNQEKKQYNPAEVYAPLAAKGTKREDLLAVLVEQITPFISPEVLKRRKDLLQELLSVKRYMRKRFKTVLEEFGVFGDVQGKLGWEDKSTVPPVEDICEVVVPHSKEGVRAWLSLERDSLSPDILERLGFVPSQVFSRREYVRRTPKKKSKDSSPRSERRYERMFHLLHEVFPKDIPITSLKGSLVNVLHGRHRMSEGKIRKLSRFHALAQWMKESQELFQQCTIDAFKHLSSVRRQVIPKDAFRQPYELNSDLYTKSIVELFEIVLNEDLPVRRRFDAISVLEWAIGLFYVRTHEIFQAQPRVQNELHAMLNIEVWDPNMQYGEVPLARDWDGGQFVPHAISGDEAPPVGSAVSRKMKQGISDRLSGYGDVVDVDMVGFDSRIKDEYSLVTKLLLRQELYKKCLAKLKGEEDETVPTEEDAHRRLSVLRKNIRESHPRARVAHDSSAALQYLGLEHVFDNLGFTFAFPLKKKMEKCTPEEQERISECFLIFGNYLVAIFGLQDATYTNNLWPSTEKDHVNPKRSKDFRDFKFLGYKSVHKEVYLPNGHREVHEIRVPVEIQIKPFEIYAVERSPETVVASIAAYQGRKARDLLRRILPQHINGEEMFPAATSEGIAESFSKVAK